MLEGIVRESTSKASTKALRRDGYLIANIYGNGVENISCAFKKNEFIKYMRNKENLAFSVKVGDNECKVVVQEYQKDPVTSDLKHVDLLAAVDGVENYFMVPVKTTGIAVGLKNKGVLVSHRRRVKVKCTPENLPNAFTLDVTNLDVNQSLSIKDVEFPEGVKTFLSSSVSLVGMIKAK